MEIYNKSMEEFETTSTGAAKRAIEDVSGVASPGPDTMWNTEREG